MPKPTELTIYKPEDVDYLPDTDQWKNRFLIPGSTGKNGKVNIYTISQNIKTNLWHCSCPRGRTKRECKHLDALQVPTPPKLLGAARRSGTSKRPFAMNYETYDAVDGAGDSSVWQDLFGERMGLQEATRLVAGKSPFEILAVSAKADWTTIRTAYRKLARQLHPDLNPGDPKAEARFKLAVHSSVC